jgi:hypothetical protein
MLPFYSKVAENVDQSRCNRGDLALNLPHLLASRRNLSSLAFVDTFAFRSGYSFQQVTVELASASLPVQAYFLYN